MIIQKTVKKFSLSCLALLISTAAYAAVTPASSDDKDKIIQAITQRTELLEREVNTLKHELKLVQAQRANNDSNTMTQKSKQFHKKSKNNAAPQFTPVSASMPASPLPSQSSAAQQYPDGSRHNLPAAPNLEQASIANMPAILFLGGTPVVTAPYIGVRSEFDASDLIVNIPSVNEDLRLLNQWQHLEKEYAKYGRSIPTMRPYIDLSGKVEAQAIYTRPFTGRRNSDIDVTAAEFDVSARVTSWAGAYIAMTYDNSQTVPQRTANSHLFVNKAFVTAGDLDQFPMYVTMGQAYPPFGLYSTSMVSAPLTQLLARTKARYIQLGYANPNGQGLNGAVYAFRGNSATVVPSNRINQTGVNVGYKYSQDNFKVSVGGGVISNIADSDGMQATGGSATTVLGMPAFTGFGSSTKNEQLVHQIPAADLHAELGYGSFGLLGEYIASTRAFDTLDMMFNGHGAKPQALHLEGTYNFHVFPVPASLSIGYQQTMQSLALLLPERRYIAAINTSLFRSTIQTLEFRHDINYSLPSIASGQAMPMEPAGTLGETADMLTLQFGVYF